MSIETVKKSLKPYGLDTRIQEFSVSSATVSLAAAALGIQEARIAKTLSFLIGEDTCIVVVAAGDAKIHNSKFKAAFGVKAKMVPFDLVESLTGHPVGGVCPFALNDAVKVYLDDSLKRFDTVFPAAGTPNSALEVTVEELYTASHATGFVDVCKLPEEAQA